jgi:hypothetical protein
MHLFRNKIVFSFVIFVATKEGRTKKIFPSPLLMLLYMGYVMDKNQNQDSGSGINIPDPQQ